MAKRKQNKQRKQIKRQTRHFQLRVEHPVDQHIAEILDYKRSKRAEVTAIRDGVRLLWALENNDLSVLFEMFPHLKAQFGGVGGLDDIAAKLELLLAQKTTGGYLLQSAAEPAGQGPKQLNAPSLAMPVFEMDDEPTVIISRAVNTTAGSNLVNSLATLYST